MTKEEFEKLVEQGIGAIPKNFLDKLNNVDIVIEDEPTAEQLRKLKVRKDSLLFGLYEGIPQTKRWAYSQVLPDKITIFQKPIEQYSQSPEEIKEIVKNTIWHEIAHHFGIDEKRVRQIEFKRKK